MDDGVKSCGELQENEMEPRSPGKHAADGCLWRGIAQGRPGCAPSFQVRVRWEMSAVQGGSRHSWPREARAPTWVLRGRDSARCPPSALLCL